MPRTIMLDAALNANSPLREAVHAGAGAIAKDHIRLIAEDERSRIGDSLDLGAAIRDECPEENR
jgi:hypothetical protein